METKIHIETPRLLLREWEEADVAPFARMNADPRVMEYFPALLSLDETRRLYDRIRREFAECGFGLFAVQRVAEGDFIGFVGLHRIGFDADFTPGVEVGWRLSPAVWGRGYAPEAAAACLVHAREALGLERVYAFTALPNVRSQRVMRKIGMERVGEFDHPSLPPAHPLARHVLYEKRLAASE